MARLMTKFPRQTKRSDLVKRLKQLGFTGPHTGVGDHPLFMTRDQVVVKLPNPHEGDIGIDLLKTVLGQAGISRGEWMGEE
jgi:predicted RNA binding protein YcfA (HicA-like mRNA interferase family)